jgi:hypothetical protein
LRKSQRHQHWRNRNSKIGLCPKQASAAACHATAMLLHSLLREPTARKRNANHNDAL